MKTLPTIVAALRGGRRRPAARRTARPWPPTGRTDRDLPDDARARRAPRRSCSCSVGLLTFKPVPGAPTGAVDNLMASLLVVIFGFLFVTVSSRICGLIGTSANPISGMTIATLMATCALFLAAGWTAPAYGALALTIGGMVCIAAANAGATSQDLKTGFLVGATPSLPADGPLRWACSPRRSSSASRSSDEQGPREVRAACSSPLDAATLPEGVVVEGTQGARRAGPTRCSTSIGSHHDPRGQVPR